MERPQPGVAGISPPDTRDSSAHSSPSVPPTHVNIPAFLAQQPQQQKLKPIGKAREAKQASSSASGSRSTAKIDTSCADGARSSRIEQVSLADKPATACCRSSSKRQGGAGFRTREDHSVLPKPATLPFEHKRDAEAENKSRPRKQQGPRDMHHHASHQRPNRRPGHSNSAPSPTFATVAAASMSAVASGDKSAFGSSMQGKGHSKQPSVRSTDDDAGSPKYGAHGDETEDSDSEYAIGFSQEEWNAQVLGRSALPTGLERSLTAQILHTYETRLFPSAQSIEVKRSFIEKFATILTTEFPDWEVDIHVFGSSVNGLGTSRSDVDICLTTSHKELENVFVLSKALRKYGMRTYCVPHARVPIVKSWDPELRIASDINVNNTIALHNTRMIQTFVAIDARVRPFVMAIKHWSKCRELNDAAFGGTLSPYAWVNLAVNFLQTRTPPILPVIHPPASSLSAVECMRGGELDLTFNDDIDQLRGFGIPNTESLGYLLYAFFRTYAFEFDFRSQVVSLRHGCFLTKEQKGWDTGRPSRIFCIEEPFSTWLNLGHSANTTSVEGIRQEFQRAFVILRDGGSYDNTCEVYQRPQCEFSPGTPDQPSSAYDANAEFATGAGAIRRVAEDALVQPVSFHAADNQSRPKHHQRRGSYHHSTCEAPARAPAAKALGRSASVAQHRPARHVAASEDDSDCVGFSFGAMPKPAGMPGQGSNEGLLAAAAMGCPSPGPSCHHCHRSQASLNGQSAKLSVTSSESDNKQP